MSRPPNRLSFLDPKTPVSERFDDIYFANEVGIEESVYVYLEGTGALGAIREGRPDIRIGEVGFGVGLNFLLTLRAFLNDAKPEQTLHYASAELFPIEKEDLLTLYRAYPELLPYAETLIDQYPILTPGVHRLFFENRRVTLDLFIGDAAKLFSNTDFQADFWYWDGFAPSKNPDAFSNDLFAAVQKRSAPGARGTSFTAAGWVRKSLSECGFQVSKRKGFGKKRECIEAILEKAAPKNQIQAWFSREAIPTLKSKDETIAVLGAGLAGSAIARALAERGYQVKVYDGNGIANRASSNSVALFNVQLSKLPNPLSRFSQSALVNLLNELKRLTVPHHLGITRKDSDALACLETSAYPDSFFELTKDGVYFPNCGMLNPQHLCEKRLNHPNIKLIEQSAASVEKNDSHFSIRNSEGIEMGQALHVVYALGADVSLNVSPLQNQIVEALPIKPVRGQTLLVKPTSESQSIRSVRVDSGYVSPLAPEITGHSFHLIGATYQAKAIAPNQEQIDTENLIEEAKAKWTEFASITRASVQDHKVGFRASTPDKLPLIGPLCDEAKLEIDYAHALRGAHFSTLPALSVRPGEWVFMGLGSRGVSFSSLGAEILASFMTGESLPIEQDLMEHLHPVRFPIRKFRRVNSNIS